MSLFTKFATVGGATMASRVLGFVREVLIAATLGAGPVADAFYAAFRFPNLFRRLFAEGAFNSAFVPLFSKELETGGREAAQLFATRIFSVLLLVLITLSALTMIFMPFLVGTIIAPSFALDPEKFDLTVLLTRIMFPYLATMSFVAMFSGILNAFRQYFLAAIAPVLLNVFLIAVLSAMLTLEVSNREIGIAMAWGVVLSGFAQLGLLIYGLKRAHFAVSLKMPALSPSVKRLLVLAFPTAIAGGITQINLLVGQIIASAQEGAIAIMNYADRLMQLPLGIIGISIGVVLLPELSRALAGKQHDEAAHLQSRSLEFGLGLTVPAAVGLCVLALPIVTLLYERGAFTRETSELTAQVLAAFTFGLPAFVMIKIFQPAFYAREDMKTPMWFSGINAVVNIALSIALFPRFGVVGLAAATSIAGWVNVLLLWGAIVWRKQVQLVPSTYRNIGIIVFASLMMGTVLHFGSQWIGANLIDDLLAVRAALLLGLIGIASTLYFVLVLATGAIPRQQLLRLIKKR